MVFNFAQVYFINRVNIISISFIGVEKKVPVGILETRLELIPVLSTDSGITEEVVKTQVNLERSRQAERDRLFLVYARQWWSEYGQIRSSYKDRLVKIFAQVLLLLTYFRFFYGN